VQVRYCFYSSSRRTWCTLIVSLLPHFTSTPHLSTSLVSSFAFEDIRWFFSSLSPQLTLILMSCCFWFLAWADIIRPHSFARTQRAAGRKAQPHRVPTAERNEIGRCGCQIGDAWHGSYTVCDEECREVLFGHYQ
jgi:hypothetical protein